MYYLTHIYTAYYFYFRNSHLHTSSYFTSNMYTTTKSPQSTTWVKKESEIEAAKAASLSRNDHFEKLMPPWMKNNDFLKKIQTSASKHTTALRQHAFVSNFNSLTRFRPFKGL